jgi:hypothetical protein
MNILPPLPSRNTQKRHSFLGILSLSADLLAVILFAVVMLAGSIFVANPTGISGPFDHAYSLVTTFLTIIYLILPLLGVLLGFIGLFQKGRKKLFALLGLVVSVLLLASIVVFFALFLFMGGA